MRLKGSLLLLLAAAAARAAEPVPPAQDSISAAKSDLASIKAPQVQTDLSQTLPAVDAKDADPMPSATLPSMASLLGPDEKQGAGGLQKKEGTGNWLVDAMDKTDPAKAKERADLLKADPRAGRMDNEFALVDQGREKAPAAEPAKAPVFNPLDSFMAGWISAKDQEVLLPVSKGEIVGTDTAKPKAESLQNLDLGPTGSASEAAPGLDGILAPDAKAAPNPYLAEVDVAPLAQVKGFAAPELPAIPSSDPVDLLRGPTAPEMDSKALDLSRSFIPDFAQPDGDDKYFKQMKRF